MASESFGGILRIFDLVILVFIWVCIAINFFVGTRDQKIHLAVVVAGYLLILYYIENFFAATTFMTLWFLFTGIEFFVSKEILLILFITIMFLGFANPFFYIIAFALYALTLLNFILSSLKKVKVKW